MTTGRAAAARLSAAKHAFVSRMLDFYVQLLSAKRRGPAAAVLRETVLALEALLEQGRGNGTAGATDEGRVRAFLIVHRLSLLILAESTLDGAKDEAVLDAFDAAVDLSALLGRREFSIRRRAPLAQRMLADRRRTAPRAGK